MWQTSKGERVLKGAEAKLFASSVLFILDDLKNLPDMELELGSQVFDNLTIGQQVSVLGEVSHGLLCEKVSVIPLTAVNESCIAGVFNMVSDLVSMEIEEGFCSIRKLVAQTHSETLNNKINPKSNDLEEWHLGIISLSESILWDADYDEEAQIADLPPDEAKEVKSKIRTSDDYFAAIPVDLNEQEILKTTDRVYKLCRGYVQGHV